MEVMREWTFWSALISLASAAWGIAEAVRFHRKSIRLDRESFEKRPLLPQGAAELLRPGDTLLIVIPNQYQSDPVYINYMGKEAKKLSERGITFCCFQQFMTEKSLILIPSGGAGDRITNSANHLDGGVSGNSGAQG